ncbi:MAG: hypothetical protein K0R40_4314 [Burkholderiales bacterium]|nr:hypothetical protein [Burkholderiales bacterium]
MTTSPESSSRAMPTASTLRTAPVNWKSTPLRTPIGCAVMKFPEATRMRAPAIGEFGSPCESSASISTRSTPAACFTAISACPSVMRRPCA